MNNFYASFRVTSFFNLSHHSLGHPSRLWRLYKVRLYRNSVECSLPMELAFGVCRLLYGEELLSVFEEDERLWPPQVYAALNLKIGLGTAYGTVNAAKAVFLISDEDIQSDRITGFAIIRIEGNTYSTVVAAISFLHRTNLYAKHLLPIVIYEDVVAAVVILLSDPLHRSAVSFI